MSDAEQLFQFPPHDHVFLGKDHETAERRTWAVIALCTVMMIADIRGGVAGLMAEVVEDHIRTHLVDPERNPGALNADAADQLIEVVHTYLK